MHNFLLIVDDEVFAKLLQRGFQRHGLQLDCLSTPQALNQYTGQPDGIILDLNLKGEYGLDWIPTLTQRYPDAKILMLTGYASISTAVSAIKLGAWQYLPKPADVPLILQAFQVADVPTQEPPAPNEDVPSLQRLKWEHIQFVLDQNQGNISATARALNMHRRSLQRMLLKKPVHK